MGKRLFVAAIAAAGATTVASLGVVVAGPAAHGAANLCVSVNGTQRAKSGSANCSTDQGNNVAIALGDGALASAGAGTKNTATAIGSGSDTSAGAGNNNRATAVGTGAGSDAGSGNKNTATAVGSPSFAAAGDGNNDTAVGARTGCSVNAFPGNNIVLHCP